MRGETDIKSDIEQIVLETVAGLTQRKIRELRLDDPLVDGLGLPSKQVHAIFDSINRRLNLNYGDARHDNPDLTIQDIIDFYSKNEMNKELAGLSDHVIGVVSDTLARKSPRIIDVRQPDVFLVRDLGFSTLQKEEILRTIEHRLEGSTAHELHTQPDCTVQEIICFYFVDAYKRLSRHSLKTRICGFLSRWFKSV